MTKHLGSIPRLPTIWAELVLGLLYSRRPLEDELAVEPRPTANRFVPKGMVFDSPFFRSMNSKPVYILDKLAGYACGECEYVFVYPSHMSITIAQEGAEKHCTCRNCGKPITKVAGFGMWCALCAWAHRFSSAWDEIGKCIKLGITNEVVWYAIKDCLNGTGDYGYVLEKELKRPT